MTLIRNLWWRLNEWLNREPADKVSAGWKPNGRTTGYWD